MPRGIRTSILDVLAHNKFVASDAEVGKLAEMNLSAIQTEDNVRGVYLKVLVAGVQQATKPVGRRKAGDSKVALTKVHERFYAVVLKAITTPEVADEDGLDREAKMLRALERNRRSNFARTARSALSGFLEAGGDVHTLNVMTVTKRELLAFAASIERTTEPTQEELAHKTSLAVDRVEEMARQLADEDKDAAVVLIEEAMAKLANLLAELGRDSTTKTMVAIKEHRPLRLGEGTFWPMGKSIAPPKESIQ